MPIVHDPITRRTRSLVKAVTIVTFDAGGRASSKPVEVFAPRRRRRRVSRRSRPFEKLLRRLGRAQSEASSLYLDRHQASNERKKNGWRKDLGKNMRKARRRAFKILKLRLY